MHMKNFKLSKHSTAIVTSVMIVLLLNVALLIFQYVPAQQNRDDFAAEHQQKTKEVDALRQQIMSYEATINELNEAMPTETVLEHAQQPWELYNWKSEFAVYLAATEIEHDVTFTDIVYTQVNLDDEATVNQDSFSLVMGGSLANIAAAMEHMYHIPALFEVLSWDISAQQLSVAPSQSDDEQYVLRLQGEVTFIQL